MWRAAGRGKEETKIQFIKWLTGDLAKRRITVNETGAISMWREVAMNYTSKNCSTTLDGFLIFENARITYALHLQPKTEPGTRKRDHIEQYQWWFTAHRWTIVLADRDCSRSTFNLIVSICLKNQEWNWRKVKKHKWEWGFEVLVRIFLSYRKYYSEKILQLIPDAQNFGRENWRFKWNFATPSIGPLISTWRVLKLNSWPDRVAISRYMVKHGSNSYIWFSRKMLDLLILKSVFSLLNCMRDLLLIIYKKLPFSNYSPIVISW